MDSVDAEYKKDITVIKINTHKTTRGTQDLNDIIFIIPSGGINNDCILVEEKEIVKNNVE